MTPAEIQNIRNLRTCIKNEDDNVKYVLKKNVSLDTRLTVSVDSISRQNLYLADILTAIAESMVK